MLNWLIDKFYKGPNFCKDCQHVVVHTYKPWECSLEQFTRTDYITGEKVLPQCQYVRSFQNCCPYFEREEKINES